MAGPAALCHVAVITSMIAPSPFAGASHSSHSSSRFNLPRQRAAFANPSSSDSLRRCFTDTRAVSRNQSPCSSSADCSPSLFSRAQTDATQRSAAGLLRRRKQEISCSALAPASTEQKEYDYGSPKMKKLMAFLEEDLTHLFDDKGIDKSMYDPNVDFRDPITKYGNVDGYMFNIQMLRLVMTPKFELHSIKQTGPTEITYRWTMTMYFRPLPWKPELIFTGISVMGVNEETGKFCRHWDFWDSVENNEYFSMEAVMDLLKQLRIYKTPDLETPKYKVLKRTSLYEVRRYEQFLVAETPVDEIAGNKGFNAVAGYLFGKNSTGEKMKMTTPVFNQTSDNSSQLQFVLPLESQISSVPSPLADTVKVRPVEGRFAAVVKFSGQTTDEIVKETEKKLRVTLIKDGLKPEQGFLLARYNDPGRTRDFLRRNEVIIWLEDFTLETV